VDAVTVVASCSPFHPWPFHPVNTYIISDGQMPGVILVVDLLESGKGFESAESDDGPMIDD
jgi:hypothetical protein